MLPRLTPEIAVFLLGAAAAWFSTVARANDMGGAMPGTMGLGLLGFVVMWGLMMAAMMLPSVAPVASMYSRSVRTHRPLRLALFGLGYLCVWTAAGVPAFADASLIGRAAEASSGVAAAAAVAAFAVCGVYQLTPLKNRCLLHCRSPLSLLLRYGSYKGRFRNVAAGVHHGAYCLGCCWTLFVVLIALGVMNVWAMVVLAIVVLIEKRWSNGVAFSRAVGVAALVCAVAVVWVPELAPGVRVGHMV